MITLKQIKTAAVDKDYAGLRVLHDRAKTEGIEDCDNQTLSTINLAVLTCSLYGDASPGHMRSLLAMIDAVERGNHPYDDIITMSTLSAEAAIAQAQLDAMVGKS